MSLEEQKFIAIGSVALALVVLRLLMNANIKRARLEREMELRRKVGKDCPGTGKGKLHMWVYNEDKEHYICEICNKRPGDFATNNGEY